MLGVKRKNKSTATISRRTARNVPPQANGGTPKIRSSQADELLMEDPDVISTQYIRGPPVIKLLMSNDWTLFLGLFAFRSVNALILQTSFVPDEFWQSMEVAHKMAFGYGYVTWEWRHGLRGYLYPLMFSVVYKILGILHLDNRILLIKLPRLIQAVFAAAGDLYLYKTARKLSGTGVARWTLLCQLTSWFTFYTSVRVLTNSMETSLTTIALYLFPWPGCPRKAQWKYISVVCLAVIIRPTAAVVWLPLCTWHLWLYRHKILKLIMLFAIVGLGVLAMSLWIDRVFYGSWTNVQYNFLRFNVVSNLSTFYGSHPWHWYLTQGFPVILGSHIIPFGLSLKRCEQPFLMAVGVWTISIYSLLGHKEFRFIFPVLPIAMYYCGLFLHSLTKADLDDVETLQSPEVHSNTDTNYNTQLANNQSRTSQKIDSSSSLKKLYKVVQQPQVLIIFLVITNLPIILYTCLLHQRGTIDVMNFIHEETKYEVKNYNKMHVKFLMPCHSTPYYSYIHKNISMQFLTCEPPLNITQPQDYIDEADLFYQNPSNWLNKHFENEDKSSEMPTHLVMFNVLYPRIVPFLEKNNFVQCAKFFHSHVTEGRVGSHVIVLCSTTWLKLREDVKKRRKYLYLS